MRNEGSCLKIFTEAFKDMCKETKAQLTLYLESLTLQEIKSYYKKPQNLVLVNTFKNSKVAVDI